MDKSRKPIDKIKLILTIVGIALFLPLCVTTYSFATREDRDEWQAYDHAEKAISAITAAEVDRELDNIKALAKRTNEKKVKAWYEAVKPYHQAIKKCNLGKCSGKGWEYAMLKFRSAFRKGSRPKGLDSKGDSTSNYIMVFFFTGLLAFIGGSCLW